MLNKPILNMQSPDEVETVFYEAFMHADSDVMQALWAEGNVVCIHPGSGAILGYEAVARSWKHILENSQPSEIRYTLTNKTVTDDMAVHIVTEEIMHEGSVMAVVVATNVYQKFAHGWLMIEHHGSVMQQQRQGETLQ